MSQPLIFHRTLLDAAAGAPRYRAPLLLRWAAQRGTRGSMLRRQLERAAKQVPEAQRRRVLGFLLSASASDDQVRTTVGVLLLAKTFCDLGWSVQYEPETAGGTPDLRITKGDARFVVEARRIPAADRQPSDRAVARIRDALAGLQTRTPISIRTATVDEQASLRPFVRYLKDLLNSGAEKRRGHTFHERGVLVGFDIGGPFPRPMNAVMGWSGRVLHGRQRAEVRTALDEKLRKYKVPLVVALDFFDFLDPFETVEEELFGSEVTHVPIDLGDGRATRQPYAGRTADSMLLRTASEGERARNRLQAVLAFALLPTEEGPYELRARVYANPIAPLPLKEFAPIPRLVVIGEHGDHRGFAYVGHRHRRLSAKGLAGWRHVP